MADTKISALPAATTPLAGTEVLPIVQSGTTKQVSVADLTAGRAVSASSLSLTNALTTANGGTGLSSYTAGDLPYYASGTSLTNLGIGSNGQILTSTGSAPAWSNVSGVAVTSISFGTTGLTPSTATQGAVTVAGTLVAANGGTGQSSYAVGDLLYASTTTALSKLADVATGNALISGGVGVAPSWGKVGLTTHVSGTLAVTNGGTGLSSVTQGDLLYGSASNTLSALAKNTTASRYLSNSGTSNNPAWAQVDLTNGVTGTLPGGNGGTGKTGFTANYIPYGSGTAGALTESSGLVFDGTRFWVNASSSSSTTAYIQANVNGGNGATGYIGMFHGGSNLANQTAGYMIGKTDLTMYSLYDGNGNARNNIYVVAQTNGVVLNSGATAWAAISDERQKIIIEPIASARGKVAQLRTVIGRYKTDPENTRRVFYIAQDFLKVLPEATNIQDEGLPSELITLQYTDALPLLTAAFNELQTEFDAYKASHP